MGLALTIVIRVVKLTAMKIVIRVVKLAAL